MLAIYPVRPGDHNPELAYSVRSLANAPQIDEVWTVGHCPAWLSPDRHIDGNRRANGHANVYDNIRLACHAAKNLGEDVAIFNDDFYLTDHVAELPTLYRSTLDEHLDLPRVRKAARRRYAPDRWWPDSLNTTRTCLQAHGIAVPLSYELHVPFLCNPDLMAQTLHQFRHVTPDNPPQWRTLYGNLHEIGGHRTDDAKAYSPGQLRRPFHSTEDQTFSYFATQLDALFPDPSRYEKVTAHVA